MRTELMMENQCTYRRGEGRRKVRYEKSGLVLIMKREAGRELDKIWGHKSEERGKKTNTLEMKLTTTIVQVRGSKRDRQVDMHK